MSFNNNLRLALDCSGQLTPELHLGEWAYSWTNRKLEWKGDQPGFRKLTADELRQLARRLHAAPYHRVVFLNLHGQDMGSDAMLEMAPAIATLEALQVLVLNGDYYLYFVCFVGAVIWGCIMRCGASVFTRCREQYWFLRMLGACRGSAAPLGASSTVAHK